tara:strand:+ start:163 stop:453 length:291 start_codon:yes stop_codon:yes gene_type:complete
VQILKEQNVEFEEIQYIKNPLTVEELKEIASKLGLQPKEFIRKGDVKKLDLEINLENDNEVFQNMVDYPKIMERPIIVKGAKAVIGRPPEKVLEIL